MRRNAKRKALTVSELLAVIAAATLVVVVLIPGLYRSRQTAIRLLCQTNLEGIGRAMTTFAADNAGLYPRAGGPGSYWTTAGRIANAFSLDFEDAFAPLYIDPDTGEVMVPGEATITSSFYLLVKYSMATPKQFICRGDVGVSEFEVATFYRTARDALRDPSLAWDFGDASRAGRSGPQLPYPGEMVSYSYHMPYSQEGSIETFVITDLSHLGSPVCADRNPYLDKNAPAPPGEPNGIRSYNSASHFNRGQNVLYKDGHVKFETSPIVGIAGDNIYTCRYTAADDPSLGAGPVDDGDPAARPLNETDALLLGERNGRTR
jgi:hypothetical protein